MMWYPPEHDMKSTTQTGVRAFSRRNSRNTAFSSIKNLQTSSQISIFLWQGRNKKGVWLFLLEWYKDIPIETSLIKPYLLRQDILAVKDMSINLFKGDIKMSGLFEDRVITFQQKCSLFKRTVYIGNR